MVAEFRDLRMKQGWKPKHLAAQNRPLSNKLRENKFAATCASSSSSSTWCGEPAEAIDDHAIRLGLQRIKGLTKTTAARVVGEREARPFESLADFLRRVHPNEKERRLLAKAGALNDLPEVHHRRDALWQVELPLHDDLLPPESGPSMLAMMTPAERLATDFATQGASTGPHPMKLWRDRHPELRLPTASQLHILPSGFPVTIAGMAICRQRPGTAKGHCFISLEDETGIANLFVNVKTFRANKLVIVSESFLLAEGRIQISEGNQPTIYVTGIRPLQDVEAGHGAGSHDFH